MAWHPRGKHIRFTAAESSYSTAKQVRLRHLRRLMRQSLRPRAPVRRRTKMFRISAKCARTEADLSFMPCQDWHDHYDSHDRPDQEVGGAQQQQNMQNILFSISLASIVETCRLTYTRVVLVFRRQSRNVAGAGLPVAKPTVFLNKIR